MDLNIEGLVSKQVRLELEGMDLPGIIESEVRQCIASGVGKEIVASVSAVAKHMIAEEVRKALDGEVKTDDGWGKKNAYPNFEQLFRQKFKAAMDDTYEVKRVIEKQVAERVQSLIKQDYNKVIEKIVDEISKTRLVKPAA